MSVGSPNKAIKSGLIETLQRKIEPPKLYDALKKMDADINATYETLFDGPLPAVNANALTHLNSQNIDGVIPEANLPANIAFQDRNNYYDDVNFYLSQVQFATGEVTTDDDGVRGTDVTRFLRLGGMAEGQFFLSADLAFDTDFLLDDGATSGFAATFIDGDVQFNKWLDDGLGAFLAETWFFNGRELGIMNFLQTDELSLCLIDENDVLILGDKASTFTDLYRGHIAIPNKEGGDLPPAGPESDGIIVIDKTSQLFCWYSASGRFSIAGTSF